MARSSPRTWLAACAASALLLCAVVVWLSAGRTGRAPTPGLVRGAPPGLARAAKVDAGATCTGPVPTLVRAHPDAEGPPLLLWAVGEVRLFLDGEAVFSPPEAPRHFTSGEHVLRIEAEGHAPMETRLRLDAFTPALVHAQVDGAAGITAVRVGTVCMSCASPVSPLELGSAPTGEPMEPLMNRAAHALRREDWREAAELLRAVPVKARRTPLFRRLEAATWLAAAEPMRARAAAEAIRGPEAHELDRLLARLAELEKEEQQRYASVVLTRWNRITEQHAALLRAATGQVQVNADELNRRMEALSAAFNEARAQGDAIEQERVFVAAEKTTAELLAGLVAERPNDCAFQTRLAATLAGSDS